MTALAENEVALLDGYWRAANYLCVGQIYLRDNPLLREPLRAEHIKPRLLGHWGTCPGLNLIYAHLNRLIRRTGVPAVTIAGPGHGGPALLANTWLEGSYTETYPQVTADLRGMRKLFEQFSWPGGVPSHVAPQVPGSIHEGGELGYALAHAFGVAFDNPGLLVACVIGDGEAETGPLAAGWQSVHFLNPKRDGAVLPILHLNGYKIAGPTVMGRMTDEDLTSYFTGLGYEPRLVTAVEPLRAHRDLAAAFDGAFAEIARIRQGGGEAGRPRWPMIVLRSPKGWTCPATLNGRPLENSFRSHQVPIPDPARQPAQLQLLEQWLLSYKPAELFDPAGALTPALRALIPEMGMKMGTSPHANGGLLLKPLELPDFKAYAVPVPQPGVIRAEATRQLGKYLRDVFRLNEHEANFRLFCPDETSSNRLDSVFEATGRCWMDAILPGDEHLSPDGRVLEVLSEHCCEGWLEGYLLSGRHGLFPCYEAFVTIVDSMVNQHAKWLKTCRDLPWRRPVASLNILLTSHSWRQDHNGYSHQGPGFINTVLQKKSSVARIYLPPDANCLLSVADHCLRSRDYINLIVCGKQPELQWLNAEEAIAHCRTGASAWAWAGTGAGSEPDVILAAAGDVPTLETMAAAWLLRRKAPGLRVRVVNVVDLMALLPHQDHPHGLDEEAFEGLFTARAPVIFAFHGYPRVIHELIYRRSRPERFHVRGYEEEGTTTTPFDMAVCNRISRFHLAAAALERVPRLRSETADLSREFEDRLRDHRAYIRREGEDLPEIRDWVWSP